MMLRREKQIIVETVCGLGNRLQGLVSAQRLAHLSGRRLHLIWNELQPYQRRNSAGRFSDLFENPIDEMDNWESLASETSIVTFINEPLSIDWNWGNHPPGPSVRSAIVDIHNLEEVQTICIRTKGILFDSITPLRAFEQELASLFLELEPVRYVSSIVNAIQSTFFTENMLGVHIRRGDFLELMRYNGTCITAVEDYIRCIDQHLEVGPFDRLYLATDDTDVRVRLRQRYGTQLCVSFEPRSLDRSTVEAIQDALIDLLLLSRSRYLIGTKRSSFSRVASWPNLAKSVHLSERRLFVRSEDVGR